MISWEVWGLAFREQHDCLAETWDGEMRDNKKDQVGWGEKEVQQKRPLFSFPKFYEEAAKGGKFQIKDWSVYIFECYFI